MAAAPVEQSSLEIAGEVIHVDGWDLAPPGWEATDGHPVCVDAGAGAPSQREPQPPPPALRELELDAIAVLAGGVDEHGAVHEWVKRRLLAAVDMYHWLLRKNGGREDVHVLVLGGGTYHKAHFMNARGFPVHESTACADFLLQYGVSKLRILKEWSSYDTIANGFYCRANHTDLRGWDRLLVITSDFHLPRARDIFEWVYGLGTPAQPEGSGCQLSFLGVSDDNIDDELIAARREREARSRATLAKTRSGITTMARFHAWLYHEHKAYSVSARDEREMATGATLRSY